MEHMKNLSENLDLLYQREKVILTKIEDQDRYERTQNFIEQNLQELDQKVLSLSFKKGEVKAHEFKFVQDGIEKPVNQRSKKVMKTQ